VLKGGYLQKNIYTFEVPVFGQYKKMYTFIFTFYTDNGLSSVYPDLDSALKDVRQFSISLKRNSWEAKVVFDFFTEIVDTKKFFKTFHKFYKKFQKYAEENIKWKSEDFYLDELIFIVNSKMTEPSDESFTRKFERNAPLEGRTTDSALYWKNIAAQLFEKLEERK
jgi:hypothetical protein